jgi:hypothetical protein
VKNFEKLTKLAESVRHLFSGSGKQSLIIKEIYESVGDKYRGNFASNCKLHIDSNNYIEDIH